MKSGFIKFCFRPHKALYLSCKGNFYPFPYRRYMHKNKIIFIHIPRTGGTSLLRFYGEKETGRDHSPWSSFKLSNPHAFKHYLKFAIVRNPWDRVVSAYDYLLSGGNKKDDLLLKNEIDNYDGFDNFVLNGLTDFRLRNITLFIPQSHFICNKFGTLMIDVLLHFENYQSDLNELLGLSINSIEKVNSSSSKDFKKYYTEETKTIVANLYKEDIENFGYEFK